MKGAKGIRVYLFEQYPLVKHFCTVVRPGAPAEFEATDKSSSSITLSWKPPRKEGYSRIHTYYIMMKDCDRNTDWTHLIALPAFDRYMDYKVTGLKPKHAYRFRLNAKNIAGLGPYAETVTCETTDLEPGKCSL